MHSQIFKVLKFAILPLHSQTPFRTYQNSNKLLKKKKNGIKNLYCYLYYLWFENKKKNSGRILSLCSLKKKKNESWFRFRSNKNSFATGRLGTGFNRFEALKKFGKTWSNYQEPTMFSPCIFFRAIQIFVNVRKLPNENALKSIVSFHYY